MSVRERTNSLNPSDDAPSTTKSSPPRRSLLKRMSAHRDTQKPTFREKTKSPRPNRSRGIHPEIYDRMQRHQTKLPTANEANLLFGRSPTRGVDFSCPENQLIWKDCHNRRDSIRPSAMVKRTDPCVIMKASKAFRAIRTRGFLISFRL